MQANDKWDATNANSPNTQHFRLYVLRSLLGWCGKVAGVNMLLYRKVVLLCVFVALNSQHGHARKINIGFDKFPLLLDLADYRMNHTALNKYYWCKFKLTIYF